MPLPLTMSITIPGELTQLNDYIRAERGNKYVASKIKKDETERVCQAGNQSKMTLWAKHRYTFHFHWYCKNERKDPDNIAFAKKFILDGLKESGVIPNDGWKTVKGFSDTFHVDVDNPRVEVIIIG